LDVKGQLMGAVSLAIPEIRYSDGKHRSFCLDAIVDVTARLSSEMGYRQTP
jgi:hypothetical protein